MQKCVFLGKYILRGTKWHTNLDKLHYANWPIIDRISGLHPKMRPDGGQIRSMRTHFIEICLYVKVFGILTHHLLNINHFDQWSANYRSWTKLSRMHRERLALLLKVTQTCLQHTLSTQSHQNLDIVDNSYFKRRSFMLALQKTFTMTCYDLH